MQPFHCHRTLVVLLCSTLLISIRYTYTMYIQLMDSPKLVPGPKADDGYMLALSMPEPVSHPKSSDGHMIVLPKPEHPKSGDGYMFALTFGDQGTGSFINLASFLCLTSKLGSVRIVEPFMVTSVLGQNVSANWEEETKFSDIFDIEKFSSLALSRYYSPLVPYKIFLEDAPHKLLVAQYKCSGLNTCESCGQDVVEKGRIFSKLNGFEFVGHVCLDYGPKGRMNITELENQIYTNFKKSEVVVMFPRFGGVDDGTFSQKLGYRLFLNLPVCSRHRGVPISFIRPSQFVTASANSYIHEYLDGKQYISVMVRMELILRSHVSDKQAPELTEKCLNRLYQRLNKLKAEVGIQDMFLALDVGKYGSDIFQEEHVMPPILPYFDIFVSQTIKKGMTLSEWDERFTNITENQNPGYIAVIQKYIAARGDVLVLLGAESAFQSSTRELYHSLHINGKVLKLNTSCG